MIGIKTGKVIAFATRSKRCATCEAAARAGRTARAHDCRCNWDGSSKAMEADVCTELVKACGESHKAQVAILVGDDDSSTIKKVRESVNHNVDKWSDIVHAKRAFGSSMYNLQKRHKNLSGKVIDYLQKYFSYAITQNKNDPDGIRKSLKAIIPHAFGDHSTCSNTWCKYLQDPASYHHSTLPHGKDLEGEDLKKDLQEIVEVYCQNAEKLAPLGSSQANEALNNTIGSKAPKVRHYGGSESNDYRVACAVSQKNIGHSYVTQVSAVDKYDSPGFNFSWYTKFLVSFFFQKLFDF